MTIMQVKTALQLQLRLDRIARAVLVRVPVRLLLISLVWELGRG